MKALSLWQPWATLVALKLKKVETRSWGTRYAGPLAIHATKSFPTEAKQVVGEEPFASALARAFGHEVKPGTLPLGAIVAVAQLDRVTEITEDHARYLERHNALEYAFGNYEPGRFAWVFTSIHPLAVPIPCTGAQQLWDLPESAGQQLLELLERTQAARAAA